MGETAPEGQAEAEDPLGVERVVGAEEAPLAARQVLHGLVARVPAVATAEVGGGRERRGANGGRLGARRPAEPNRLCVRGAADPADVDVVKVAHHGSKDQSSLVYERLRPTLGLVSVGKNDYGHPSPSILKTLERIGARVRRTDRDGIIAVGRPALSPSAASTGRALLEVWTSGAAPSVGGGG